MWLTIGVLAPRFCWKDINWIALHVSKDCVDLSRQLWIFSLQGLDVIMGKLNRYRRAFVDSSIFTAKFAQILEQILVDGAFSVHDIAWWPLDMWDDFFERPFALLFRTNRADSNLLRHMLDSFLRLFDCRDYVLLDCIKDNRLFWIWFTLHLLLLL